MTQVLDPNTNITLQDYQHAHNFYAQHNHAFSPKVKFLYHVVFNLKSLDLNGKAPNTRQYRKEIGVLAKTVDLPGYSVNVETRNQYNRKKNVQTRINYDEVRMVFHDDNTGITSTMLKEYYNYYFLDGRHEYGDFHSRDKYSRPRKRYGLDTTEADMFFSDIKIYQLSRGNWFSYTLVNPLLTRWNHDTLDYSDGSGIMENTISVAYEAVIYNNGTIGKQAEPTGFTDQETGYDNSPSPLINKEFSRRSPQINNRPRFNGGF